MLYTAVIEVPDDYPQDDLQTDLERIENANLVLFAPTQLENVSVHHVDGNPLNNDLTNLQISWEE